MPMPPGAPPPHIPENAQESASLPPALYLRAHETAPLTCQVNRGIAPDAQTLRTAAGKFADETAGRGRAGAIGAVFEVGSS